MITVERYHDISCGHRVAGHESKCRYLHGHNYRITFTCAAYQQGLDNLGRVIDFGVIKQKLCMWLEENWDHKTLLWQFDPWADILRGLPHSEGENIRSSIILVPFNPTAEGMAHFLLTFVGPQELEGTGVYLTAVRVEETRKCSATATEE